MRKLTSAVLVLLGIFPGMIVLADAGAETQLEKLLADFKTLQADVTQLIVESDGGVLEESEIHMLLKRPDGFYWETLTPFPELVVTDGKSLWNYQPDLEQVVIEPWDSGRSELAARLLSGDTANLADEYEVAQRDTDSDEFDEFLLTPKAADSVYRQITLTFRGQALDMIYIDNNNGQKTVWQFTNLVVNAAIEDSRFEFSIPDGVEVIQNSYAQ